MRLGSCSSSPGTVKARAFSLFVAEEEVEESFIGLLSVSLLVSSKTVPGRSVGSSSVTNKFVIHCFECRRVFQGSIHQLFIIDSV